LVFNETMSYRRLVIRFCDVAGLTLLVGGLTCADAAAPGQADAEAPAPTVETAEPPPPPPDPTGEEPGEAPVEETPETRDDPLPPEPTRLETEGDEALPQGATALPVSPYQTIIARNAFGLKTPPPPPPLPEPPAAQVTPAALKLTGIVTLLGGRRATFVLQEPGKPQINSDLIREGEKDAMITNLEVLQIDERAGVVRVAYGGKEMALDFVNNGLKPPAAPTPGAPGTVPGRAVAGVAQPGVVPGARGTVATLSGGRPTPGVQPTFPSAYQAPVPTLAPASSSTFNPGTGSSGLRSIPVRPTRLPTGASTATGVGGSVDVLDPTIPPLPPEQQALIMRAQEEINRRQGMSFPPSPPVPGLDLPTPSAGPPPLPGQ